MPRVKNVDSVAPDDLSSVAPAKADEIVVKSAPVVTPIKKTEPVVKLLTTPSDAPLTSPLVDRVYDILGHTKSSLSSLLVHPHVFDFSERDSDEEILVVARQHWFTNSRWVIITILMFMAPSFLRSVPNLINIPLNYQFVGYIFWYTITFAYAYEKFISWYFNVYIITTKRIVDIDFNNLLTKKYSEAGIDSIQDVTSAVIGVIPTMFNYGNILIQTAAEINELTFERVPDPEKIIKVLQELRDHHDHGGKI